MHSQVNRVSGARGWLMLFVTMCVCRELHPFVRPHCRALSLCLSSCPTTCSTHQETGWVSGRHPFIPLQAWFLCSWE
jgi:hypothetical protein